MELQSDILVGFSVLYVLAVLSFLGSLKVSERESRYEEARECDSDS
jgi:hypothetical protein